MEINTLLLTAGICSLVYKEQNYFHQVVQYNVLYHITSYT